jgi:hypothetical protein
MQSIPENATSVENGIANGLGGQDIVQDLTKTCSMLTNQVFSSKDQRTKHFLLTLFILRYNNYNLRCEISSTA